MNIHDYLLLECQIWIEETSWVTWDGKIIILVKLNTLRSLRLKLSKLFYSKKWKKQKILSISFTDQHVIRKFDPWHSKSLFEDYSGILPSPQRFHLSPFQIWTSQDFKWEIFTKEKRTRFEKIPKTLFFSVSLYLYFCSKNH